MIGPALRLAAASAAGRAIKEAANEASNRVALKIGAGTAGAVGLFCFSRAVLEVLERHMDPAEAWACIGGFYSVVGGLFYYAGMGRKRR